jgi:hypothetical protein
MPQPPAFLRIFEGKALAKALTDAGYQLSEATAQRWIRGATTPKPQDIRAIRELVGAMLPDTTKEAAPPEWAERLEVYLLALVRKRGVSVAEMEQAEADLGVALTLSGSDRWTQLLGGGGKGAGGSKV